MQINQCAEIPGPLPKWIQRLVIQVLAVGVPMYQSPAEPQIADATLQFVGCGARILERQMRKSRITARLPLNFAGQEIVCFAGFADGNALIDLNLHTRSCN